MGVLVAFCFVFVFWLDFNQILQHHLHRHHHYLDHHRCHQFYCRHHHHITIAIIVVVVISGCHRHRCYVIIFVIVVVIIVITSSSSSLHHRRRLHIICNCSGHITMESLCVLVKDATLTANSFQCPRGIKFTHIHGTHGTCDSKGAPSRSQILSCLAEPRGFSKDTRTGVDHFVELITFFTDAFYFPGAISARVVLTRSNRDPLNRTVQVSNNDINNHRRLHW